MFTAKLKYAVFICLCLCITKTLANVGSKCNSSNIVVDQCDSEKEQCDEVTNTCQCLPGFNNENGSCDLPQTTPSYSSLVDNQGDGSLVAGILIPLVLMAFVICSIYISKRYELVKWLRHKLNQRNRNYDEFMIGQDDDDDPPLA